MESYELKSVFFKNLKGLKNANFVFQKPLTAIMGVNGSGKTTVIHALACAYQPTEGGHGENHRFSDFFVPNTDALWRGSEFHVVNAKNDARRGNTILPSRKYEKAFDRWAPRYADRPKRNVYYIGIDTCLPEIEKKTTQSRITYTSAAKDDRTSQKIIGTAAYILNKEYQVLLENTFQKKHFTGVQLRTGLKYSSLSMGTGEQRTIKILEKVYNAEPYSLILIDEIDLLLHVSSLKRLILKLDQIAREKNLQIVFTTHALEMTELIPTIGIQYIDTAMQEDGTEGTIVYNSISSDLIYSLTGTTTRPIKIYVEDGFAKAVVKKVLRMLNMSVKADVIQYGSIENAFTIAAAKVLSGTDTSNTLVVLDGDKYRTREEKLVQIRKKLSGTEADAQHKQERALGLISEFHLPEGTPPERFFHDLLIQNGNPDSELVIAADEIRAVANSHEWLYNIRQKLNDDECSIVRDIIDISSGSEQWNDYIQSIVVWLSERTNV